jgi:hypothetical protein
MEIDFSSQTRPFLSMYRPCRKLPIVNADSDGKFNSAFLTYRDDSGGYWCQKKQALELPFFLPKP